MIFEALLNMLTTTLTTLFSPLPALPDVPEAFTTATDAVIGTLAQGVYLLRYIFSTELLNLSLGILIAVFIFERGYNTIMFVLRKIPFINIK